MRRALALVALVALGCSQQYTVWHEPDAQLREATIVAIEEWTKALQRGPCPDVALWYTDGDMADFQIRWGDGKGWLAYENGGDIVVDPEKVKIDRAPELATIVAHELGHAMGANHSPHKDDLMYPKPPKTRTPTPTGYDVARVCEAWTTGEAVANGMLAVCGGL